MVIYLALALGAAFIALRQPKAKALQKTDEAAPAGTGQGVKGAGIGGAIAALGGSAGGALGEVAAVAGAAVAGFQLGTMADKAILGGDSDKVTQLSGGIAGGIMAAGVVLLAFGTLTGGVFAALVVCAFLAYSVVAIVDDLVKLSYGQEGCKRDFDAHWQQVFDQCYPKLRVGTSPLTSDAQIKRQLIPFIDGYMAKLNRYSYMQWMKSPKGITQLGLNSRQKAEHGRDRGYFLGTTYPDDSFMGQLVFDEEKYLQSASSQFAVSYCPGDEIVWLKRFRPRYQTVTSSTGTGGTNQVAF